MSDAEAQKDLIIWQQNIGESIMPTIEYELRNYRQDSEGHWKPRIIKHLDGTEEQDKPLLSESGISFVQRMVRPIISPNVLNSVYTEEQINEIILQLRENIRIGLIVDRVDFGLGEDPPGYLISEIIDLATNHSLAALNRALGGGERTTVRTVYKQNQVSMDKQESEKKAGWLGW
jgi:hypothetical protein